MGHENEPPRDPTSGDRYEQMTFDESLRHSYEREDTRYAWPSQAKDWAILIGIGVIQFLWMLVVFLIEPGIR